MLGDTLGNGDDERNLGFNSLLDRSGGKRRTDETGKRFPLC